MAEKSSSREQILEHQLRVLTQENSSLAERAEDSLLLGLISENIQNLQDKAEIFSSGLEQISILKSIPFCSCGQLSGSLVRRISSYISFSDSIELGYPIELNKEVLADLQYGPVLIRNLKDLKCTFGNSGFNPVHAVLIPFQAQQLTEGVFIFIDDTTASEGFSPMLMLLNHAIEMLVAKYDNIFLLDALQRANKQLEQRVEARTWDLKQANKALQESELKYRQLVENANDAIFVAQNNRLVFFNEKTLRDLKYSRDELSALPLADLVHPQYRDRIAEYYAKRVNNDPEVPPTYTIIALTKDQEELTVEISAVKVSWNGMPATLNFARDITEQKKLEERYHQAQKLEAIGQLASGVAHDFNNMLGGIMGAAEILGFYLPDDDRSQKFHRIIIESAGRAADLTKKLLSFSRSTQQISALVNLHEVISEALVLLKNSIDPRIKVTLNLKALRCTVLGDSSQLQNVFINLGINASHAMPDGGTLALSSHIKELDEIDCRHSTFNIKPGKYLEVEIQDTGRGIDPKHIGKIFDPFFTTKEQGQGTGLGLASVYGTIQQHGGAIHVYSETEGGTTFILLLPLADTEATQQPTSPLLQTGSGRILVVDDEEVMRLTAKAILEKLGYDVTMAVNGQDGLQKYMQESSTIDVVLLDMIMPVLNGRDCFKAMTKHNPKVRVILSSGFAKEEDLEAMKAQGLLGIVRKPYHSSTLSQAIHSAIQHLD